MTTTTPDPITNNAERVMVRQTATGFEQSIAALAGLLTAGPLGALASWGCIRGLQGKWAPWTVLGVVASPVLLVGQLAVVGSFMEAVDPEPTIEETRTFQSTYKVPTL